MLGYNGDVRVGPWIYVRTGTRRSIQRRRARASEREKDGLEASATQRSFSLGGRKKTGARFALHSWPSLWGEKRLLLRNVISMSSAQRGRQCWRLISMCSPCPESVPFRPSRRDPVSFTLPRVPHTTNTRVAARIRPLREIHQRTVYATHACVYMRVG